MAEAKKTSTKTSSKTAKAKPATKKAAVKSTVKEKKVTKAKKELKTAEKAAVEETTKKVEELIETEEIAEAIIEAEKEIEKESKSLAKAGKRSSKGIKEAEEKAKKEERKVHKDEIEEAENAKPKVIIKPRTSLERKGKKYREVAKLIDKSKEYSIKEALDLAIKTTSVKFDSTVELHVRLGVDPKQADQNIRANIVLPAGTGKTVKIAALVDAEEAEIAKKAGADMTGIDAILGQLDKNFIDFDVLIATPAVMPKLGKYARLLGPKGLMPSPKSGTVTTNVAKAITEAKAGKIEYRVDSNGIIHTAIGKASFGVEKLDQNAKTLLASIKSAKPSSIKGNYFNSVYISTSMGPSIKVDLSDF